MVDEFQDTNETQRAIIYALAGLEPPAADGLPAELFVVGEGKQSIYRFRGADVSVFQQVERDIVERWGVQRIRLDTSFRYSWDDDSPAPGDDPQFPNLITGTPRFFVRHVSI